VEVRENEMQLRKPSGGAAQLRTLEGALTIAIAKTPGHRKNRKVT